MRGQSFVIEIRKLGRGDVDAFIRIRLEGLRTDPTSFGSDIEVEKARPRDYFVEYLAPSRWRIVWGAFRGDDLVGLIRLEKEGGAAHRWIYSMYVTPAERRRGLARRLMRIAITRAKRDPGVRQIYLDVETTNERALRLYRAMGFIDNGLEDEAIVVGGKTYREYRMRKFVRSRPAR